MVKRILLAVSALLLFYGLVGNAIVTEIGKVGKAYYEKHQQMVNALSGKN